MSVPPPPNLQMSLPPPPKVYKYLYLPRRQSIPDRRTLKVISRPASARAAGKNPKLLKTSSENGGLAERRACDNTDSRERGERRTQSPIMRPLCRSDNDAAAAAHLPKSSSPSFLPSTASFFPEVFFSPSSFRPRPPFTSS